MEYTPNSNLYKPNRNDDVDIDTSLAENFTKIDSQLAQTATDLEGRSISVKRFDVKGDGTDETSKIQQALDFCENNNAKLIFEQNKTYLVSRQGARTIIHNQSNIEQPYCLLIGNVSVDLNGSTIRLMNSQNAPIFLNKSAHYQSTPNTKLEIINGEIDNNRVNQTSPTGGTMECIIIINARNITIDKIKFKEVRSGALRVMGVYDSHFDNLDCDGSDGDAYRFGQFFSNGLYDARLIDSTVGIARANECLIGKNGTLQGNPAIITCKNVSFNQLFAKKCGGGFKVQDGSEYVTINQAIFIGASSNEKNPNNSSSNSGLKIQGSATNPIHPIFINVGLVTSKNCDGEGLYIENSKDVVVNSYMGDSNGLGGSRPCVRVGGCERVIINSIQSNNAGTTAVELRNDTRDAKIGKVYILDCCSVSTGFHGVLNISRDAYIGELFATDTREEKRMSSAYRHGSTSATSVVNFIQVDGYVLRPFLLDGIKATVNSAMFKRNLSDHFDTLSDELILSSGTTTEVSNGNVSVLRTSSSVTINPIIQLIPLNNVARAMVNQITYVAKRHPETGFVLTHPTANGTERFMYKVLGYVRATTSLE